MAVIIGSARIDENGKISGGSAGDQTGKEVSTQNFYVHSKGWYILRPKTATVASGIAKSMLRACNNNNIGYDQNQRLGVITYGTASTVKTECDCSSLVRQCVREASGKDPGNFTTGNEASALEATGLFEMRKAYTSGMTLYTGDVLVTKTKGHTVIVTSGASRGTTTSTKKAYSGTFPTLPSRGYYIIGDGYRQLTGSSTKTQIQRVQSFLNWAVESGLTVDGDYGAKTSAACTKFQKAVNIETDGKFGKNTLAKAKTYKK